MSATTAGLSVVHAGTPGIHVAAAHLQNQPAVLHLATEGLSFYTPPAVMTQRKRCLDEVNQSHWFNGLSLLLTRRVNSLELMGDTVIEYIYNNTPMEESYTYKYL